MRAAISLGITASLACAIAIGCGGGGEAATGGAKAPKKFDTTGADATDFTLTDIEGREVSLSDHIGNGAIVVDFWATWCKPCMAELPHLQRLYEAKKGQGLVVLAIAVDGSETQANVAPYVKSQGFTFPVLLDTETRAMSLYNPKGDPPFTVIIDRHGKVLLRRQGFNAGDEKQLEADVERAMND
jgi:peroxiredoxin